MRYEFYHNSNVTRVFCLVQQKCADVRYVSASTNVLGRWSKGDEGYRRDSGWAIGGKSE